MSDLNIKPFVKWAGGKNQLINHIFERIPSSYNRYYEPFIGGGALLFALKPNESIINDINTQLITVYRCIKDNPKELIQRLNVLESEKEDFKKDYYEKREEYNSLISNNINNLRLAALFIYLNKRCFNGLYRVNSKGLFNVPYNGASKNIFSEANIENISKYLKKVEIRNMDFEESVKDAKEGDLIFFDSPYAPLNPTSFEAYTKMGFSEEDHIRLAKLFKSLSDKGCYCILTNHNVDLINKLYEEYKIDVITVRRAINSNATNRKGEEVIITNIK